MEVQENLDLHLLRTVDSSYEAHILRDRLACEGVMAYIFDEHTVSIDPLYSKALGGIKIKVKATDFALAKEVLTSIDNFEFVEEEMEPIHCPKCGSKEVYTNFKDFKSVKGILSILYSFIFFVYPIYYANVFRCKECEFEFKE